MAGLSLADRAELMRLVALWQPKNLWQELLKGWLLTQLARS